MKLVPRGAAGAAFPLTVMLLLALLTVWLERAVELAAPDESVAADDAPDYIVEKFTLTRLAEDGRRRYTLAAERMIHFPLADTSHLVGLRLAQPQEGRADMRIRADRGIIAGGGEVAHLYDNVELLRPGAPPGKAAKGVDDLRMTTRYLRVLPDADRADTPERVHIEQGTSTLSGVGMRFDDRYKRFSLDADVRAVYRKEGGGGRK